MGTALPLSSYLARFITSANLSQLRTFANMISSMSEAVATGMGWAASGYSPVKTPCKVAMVLLKLVVLPLTAPSCQQINSLSTMEQFTKSSVHAFLRHKHARRLLSRMLQYWGLLPLKGHTCCLVHGQFLDEILRESVQPTSYWAGKKLRSCA